jgi:hypothetical protein
MDSKKTQLIIGALGMLTLCACASTTPQADGRFGHAVNQAKLQQTLNPGPASTTIPSGMGGTPARESIERYHDTFKAPPPTFEVIFGSGGR